MKNNTLHFSLNSNMANLLANIAREKQNIITILKKVWMYLGNL